MTDFHKHELLEGLGQNSPWVGLRKIRAGPNGHTGVDDRRKIFKLYVTVVRKYTATPPTATRLHNGFETVASTTGKPFLPITFVIEHSFLIF